MKTTLLFALLTGLLCLLVQSGCSSTSSRSNLLLVELRHDTDRECLETLSAMIRAWDARDRAETEENGRAERTFLHRLVSLGRRVEGRSPYRSIASFWQRCYADHAKVYGEPNIRARTASR